MKKLWDRLNFTFSFGKDSGSYVYFCYYLIPAIFIVIDKQFQNDWNQKEDIIKGWKEYGIGISFLNYTIDFYITVDNES